MNQTERARFIDRTLCISCRSQYLTNLSTGAYDSGPVGAFLKADPWGENPLPYLAGKTWCFAGCNTCGQAFHRYVLDAEWNERRFSKWMSQDAIAEFEHGALLPEWRFKKAAENTGHALRIEALTRELRSGPVKLLDFGCGYGDFIAMCNLYGFDAVGVDRAEAKRSNALVPIFNELSDVTGPFHAVTLFEVLEHLDDPLAILEALAPMIVPGGLLVLETPDCTGVTGIETIDDYRKIHPLDHINGFTPETLRKIAERAGFASFQRPPVHVTMDRLRVVKNEVKGLLVSFLRPTTQQYFRKI